MLGQLNGQEQSPSQIPAVCNLHDAPRRLVQENISGDPFIIGAGNQALHTWCVYEIWFTSVDLYPAIGHFNCCAGVVRYVDAPAGERGKEADLPTLGFPTRIIGRASVSSATDGV